ncbi:MAG: hypothetical protein JHC74_00440 [Thermoleophilia bacterium]|nr:hypothetical protein [Thermoleophilia bacterium]
MRLRGGPPPSPTAELTRLLERLNPAALAAATGHRLILSLHLAAAGLPVPRLHGVVGRATCWSADARRPIEGIEAAARMLAAVPGDVAIRPYAAALASPTRLLSRAGAAFIDGEGSSWTPRELADALFSDPACEVFLVEESAPAAGGPRVARVITVVSDAGEARPVHARLIGPGEVVEELDVASPGTEPAGLADAYALACRAALFAAPQRSIAWDIALTDGGPAVLGADSRYERVPGPRFAEAMRAVERATGHLS